MAKKKDDPDAPDVGELPPEAPTTLAGQFVADLADPETITHRLAQAVQPVSAPSSRTIRLTPEDGIHSRGRFERGRDYIVDAAEAERLLATGHFEEVQ